MRTDEQCGDEGDDRRFRADGRRQEYGGFFVFKVLSFPTRKANVRRQEYISGRFFDAFGGTMAALPLCCGPTRRRCSRQNECAPL